MKKLLTVIALLGIFSSANMMAQDFPGDPGELKVDLVLFAADVDMPEDTIQGYAPEGSGVYNAGDVVTIQAQTIPGYTFLRWSDEEEAQARQITVNESLTLAALYSHNSYTITFVNDNGEPITSGQFFFGDSIFAPEAPFKEATDQFTYTFAGWNPTVAPTVSGSQTYQAVFDTIVNSYEIRFLNWDDELLQADTLEYGATPQFRGNDPVRESMDGVEYHFAGWEPQLSPVTGAQDYYAQFTDQMIEYTVTFRQNDIDSTFTVTYNQQIELLAVALEGQHFVSWSDGVEDNPRLANIVSDTTFTALFATNTYEIRFLNWDETILQVDTLEHGTLPQFRGAEPAREDFEGVSYEFAGWAPEIQPATEDASYTAQFTSEAIDYNVIVIIDTDTTSRVANYGSTIELEAADKADRHFLQWEDGTTSAMRTVTIYSDTVFTATYGSSFVDINVEAGQWTFFCLPQTNVGDGWSRDMFITDELSDVAWGTYNGAVRAQARSGWETADVFNPLQGYIVYSSKAGRLRLNVYPENINNGTISVALNEYAAQFEQNANWNFVGNPHTSQVVAARDIFVSGEMEATATIWNGTGYTNELLSSESLVLQPLQAFFIQTEQAGQLTFAQANGAPARRNVPAAVAENSRIDVNATAGGYTDKTRVIFRANSSLKYEAGRDASKFMTASAPVQMYFIDVDGVQCAQMVRPAGDDNMRIGYMLHDAGDITIDMPIYADEYELFDALTGNAYSLDETITLYSEAGTFNDRLLLRPIRKTPTAIDNTADAVVTTKLIINDQLFLLRDGKMFTVQGQQVR